MKILRPNFILVTCLLLLIAISCRRKADDDVMPNGTSITDSAILQETNTSSDESTVSTETNDALSAVDDFLSTNNTSLLRQGPPTLYALSGWNCGGNVSVDSSLSRQRQYTLTFTNSVCGGRTRNGKIIIRLINQTSWATASAVLRITWDNYSVSRLVNEAIRTTAMNGYHDITNVSGGRVLQATSTRVILHKVRGNVLVNINGTGTRSWRVWRTRSYSTSNMGLTVTIKGDTALGTKTNIDVIGANRYDNQFISTINTPIISNAQCGFWKPVAGIKTLEVNLRSTVVTFGLNASGTPVASGTCATHYRVKSGGTNNLMYDVVMPY